jgi:hypothetical protein
MASTTFRQDVTERLVALANDFKAANPTLLLKVYHRRPVGFTGDLPSLFVGAKNEAIRHTSGLRQRTMEPQLVLVGNPSGSEQEVADEMDTLVDEFLDYLTLHPHAISSNTVTGATLIRDTELDVDGTIYPTVVITLGETIALEGRSRTSA